MSNTLVIVAHPNLTQSRINTAWVTALRQAPNITVHDLYGLYPDEVIDVKIEQQQLTDHDRIILQFPFQWYSCPSLLKKWLDVVLEHGWAYGPGTDALHGKELSIAVSTWSKAKDYQKEDRYGRTMEELTSPFEVTALRVGMHYFPGFFLNGIGDVDDQQLAANALTYRDYIQQTSFNHIPTQ